MIPIPKTLTEGTDCYRLFEALRSGEPKSHQELYALFMIVHSRASDLRLKHGCLIDTWRDGRTTWYQLRAVREPEAVTLGGREDRPVHGPLGEVSPGLAVGRELRAAGEGAFSSPPEHPRQLSVFEAAA